MTNKPKFEDAPGLVVRPAGKQWEARWQCRLDIVGRGFTPKSRRLWTGLEPTDLERAYVSDQSNRLQGEMLIHGRGGLPDAAVFDGTVRGLSKCYQTDADSGFRKLRYRIRMNYAGLLRRLEADRGDEVIADIKARDVLAWHKEWTGEDGTKIPMAKVLVSMFRTIVGFGATFLEDEQCIRLKAVLSGMRFKSPKPRTAFLTADMVNAIRAHAHAWGWHSIAIAQAFQFELTLRQKDCIGEWVPVGEAGTSDVVWRDRKWLHGLRWSEIDKNLILRHTTSKTGKDIQVDLHHAPMVLEELRMLEERDGALPKTGPIVLCEATRKPWNEEFRRKWRMVAFAAGIPSDIRNMDTRAGAITEGTSSGAPLEHVQHAAAHSDIHMTQRYSRGAADKVANVMQFRTAHRNKSRPDD